MRLFPKPPHLFSWPFSTFSVSNQGKFGIELGPSALSCSRPEGLKGGTGQNCPLFVRPSPAQRGDTRQSRPFVPNPNSTNAASQPLPGCSFPGPVATMDLSAQLGTLFLLDTRELQWAAAEGAGRTNLWLRRAWIRTSRSDKAQPSSG